jgi:hypothetical protein
MRRSMFLVLALVLVWGCGQKAAETGKAQEPAARGAEMAAETPAGGETPAAAETPAEVPGTKETVVLAGTLGCGHCTFHTTPECAIAMKADDGRIVVIDAEDLADEDHLFAERMSGKPVSVEGNLEDVQGQLVIHSRTVTFR